MEPCVSYWALTCSWGLGFCRLVLFVWDSIWGTGLGACVHRGRGNPSSALQLKLTCPARWGWDHARGGFL